eukprot:TRINITY_DN16582_c0_g1_i1.p1 TRINITY_DN16582_c0_g1~~TRINITY_DN16582_c0_g1_i1.p1  ORF type:complete len:571 (+),score=97.14 TRINITY_DN16582_c0_g1_i1:51-1715(+)
MEQPQKKRKKNPSPAAEVSKDLLAAQRAGNIDAMMDVFRRWRDGEAKMPEGVCTQVLAAIDKIEPKIETRYAAIEEVYNTALTLTANKPKEPLLSLMIRLSCRAGQTSQALSYFQKIPKTQDVGEKRCTPRFRSITPILVACGSTGDYGTAEEVFIEEIMPMKRAGPLTDMEVLQWQDACLHWGLSVANSKALTVEAKRVKINGILHEMFSAVPIVTANPVFDPKPALVSILESCGYMTIDNVEVTSEGECKASGHTLTPSTLSKEALLELQSLIDQLATDSASDEAKRQWEDFRSWLKDVKREYTHIIDAANVGHTLQNCDGGHFSHQQIDAVAGVCVQPLIVLRGYWLRAETRLDIRKKKKKAKLPQIGERKGMTEMEKQILEQMGGGGDVEEEEEVEQEEPEVTPEPEEDPDRVLTVAEQYKKRWAEQGILLESPHNVNDDWVAMYVAVEMILRGVTGVQLVTNDIFRDHYWRMKQHPSLIVWKERYLTKFRLFEEAPTPDDFVADPAPVLYRKAVLVPPLPYTHKGQQDPKTLAWHIPLSNTWMAAVIGS